MCVLFYAPQLTPPVLETLRLTVAKYDHEMCQFDFMVSDYFRDGGSDLTWLADESSHYDFLESLLDLPQFYLIQNPANFNHILKDWYGFIEKMFVFYDGTVQADPYLTQGKFKFFTQGLPIREPFSIEKTMVKVDLHLRGTEYVS